MKFLRKAAKVFIVLGGWVLAGAMFVWNFVMNCIGILICAITG